MAKAWDNYLSGKRLGGLPREDFMQKLRQLVDMDMSCSPSDIGASVKDVESIYDLSIPVVDDMPVVPAVDVGDADNAEIVHVASEIIAESHAQAILAEEASAEADTGVGVHQGMPDSHVAITHKTHDIVPDASDELFMDDGGTEIARWTCANHHNIERDVAIYPPDTAKLLKMPDDSMMLVYNIGGEGYSHCVVDSLGDAEEMIFEDNESTHELYPDMSEALWCRV